MKRSPLIPLFLIVLIDVLGMTIILPLLPFYSQTLGASPFVVGLLVSVYGLCQFISGPILGQASDKVGRKKILVISQIGTCLGFILLAVSNNLLLVFLSRIIDGITAGNISVAQAYISDVTEPEERTHAFGMLGSAFSLGFIVGPAMTGFLSKYGPHAPIYLAAFLSFSSVIATLTLLPDSKIHQTESKSKLAFRNIIHFLKDENISPLLIQFFIFIFAFATFMSGFALFCGERFSHGQLVFGIREVGYLFTFMGAVSLFVQMGLLRRLNRIFGEVKLIITGFLTMAIGYFIIGETFTIPFLLGAMMLTTFGSSIVRPGLTSLITTKVARHLQGAVLGVMQSLQSIAQVIAPLIGGLLIDRGHLSGWAWTCAFISLLGLLLIKQQQKILSRKQAQ